MADLEATSNVVRGILAKHDIPTAETDNGFVVPAPGEDASAVVHLIPKELPNGDPAIMLAAALLSEIDLDQDFDDGPHPVIIANELNRQSHFGRWVLYPKTGTLALEYELLAEDMQEREFMNALIAIASIADGLDDDLQEQLGGSRALEDREVRMA